MIVFSNGSVFKLSPVSPQEIARQVSELFVDGGSIMTCFKGIRDFVVFTDKRLVAVNVQGIMGKKRAYTSVPYSRIQAFAAETAGMFDLDAELDEYARLVARG